MKVSEKEPVESGPAEPGAGDLTIEFVEHAEGPHSVPAELGLPENPSQWTGERSEDQDERVQQLEAQAIRLRADFENFKRRAERDRAVAAERVQAQVLKEFLPVLDNLDRALALLEREAPPEWCRGMVLVHQAFVDALARAGAVPMEAFGKPFDPQFHDAVTLCRDETLPDGAVADVLQQGYLHQGRVLRPAKVRVNRLAGGSQEDQGNG